MLIPEYTITPKTLNNISSIEYSRAVVENAKILDTLTTQLEKEALLKKIQFSLALSAKKFEPDVIKRHVDGLNKISIPQIDARLQTFNNIVTLDTINEGVVGTMYSWLTGSKEYVLRRGNIQDKTPPEEILATLVQLTDWYNNEDAQNTNSIIVAGIFKGQIENIHPLEDFNFELSNILMYLTLILGGYTFANIINLEEYFYKDLNLYNSKLNTITQDNDFTQWLEYFTECFAKNATELEVKVLELTKETKLAKNTPLVHLTDRQQKIVTYLHDYGLLKNKQFSTLFPNVSEDSVLRDLKKLMDFGIVEKRGRTKNSRYVLKQTQTS